MKLKFLVSTIVSIMIWPASIMAQSELIPMIEIPAGNFYMGTLGEDENYDEAPMHKVHISKPFKMGLTEVTNAQYELFCPGHKLLRGKNGFSNEDDEAVGFVTYQDAVAFCDWLTRKEGKRIVCLPKLNGNMHVRQAVTGTSIWMTSFLPPGKRIK